MILLVPLLLHGGTVIIPEDPPPAPPARDVLVTINGIPHDYEALAAKNIYLVSVSLSVDTYGSFSFLEQSCLPVPTFKQFMTVTLHIDGILCFAGRIEAVDPGDSEYGNTFAYSCLDVAREADYVTITSQDGSGRATYNTPPSDLSFTPTQSGKTVGQIIHDILIVPGNADLLFRAGVGGYSGTATQPVLHIETVQDLASLDMVPPEPVSLGGENILNQIRGFVTHRAPTYVMWVRPDGIIRFVNLKTMPSVSLVLPGKKNVELADPISPPLIDKSIRNARSRVRVVGRDLTTTVLSVKDGTLVPDWTLEEENIWKMKDFEQPGDASDEGVITSHTLTTATLRSNRNTVWWDANFWNGRQGTIYFYNDLFPGAISFDRRSITTTTAMSPGGTATVGWDSSIPLSNLGYDRYRIVARTGRLSLVGRAFKIREKSTGKTGLDSYVGAHLVGGVFPEPAAWANATKHQLVSTPVGAVMYSPTGSTTAWNEWPVNIEVDPDTGRVIATDPIVRFTSTSSQLAVGYPKTVSEGRPLDFAAIVMYNRNNLYADWPPTGNSGRAFEELSLDRPLIKHYPTWRYVGDRPRMVQLARELHASVADPVESGTVTYHGFPDFPIGFHPLKLGYSLNLSLSDGIKTPWTNIPLPVRTVTLTWPQSGGEIHRMSFEVSNQTQPFEGDDMYVNPAYGGNFEIGGDDGFFMSAGAFIEDAPQFTTGEFFIQGAVDDFQSGVMGAIEGSMPQVGQFDAGMAMESIADWAASGPPKAPDKVQGIVRPTEHLAQPGAADKPIVVDQNTDNPSGRPIVIE